MVIDALANDCLPLHSRLVQAPPSRVWSGPGRWAGTKEHVHHRIAPHALLVATTKQNWLRVAFANLWCHFHQSSYSKDPNKAC